MSMRGTGNGPVPGLHTDPAETCPACLADPRISPQDHAGIMAMAASLAAGRSWRQARRTAAVTAGRPLKLYVWQGVFTDWSSGLAVAIAPDIRTARRLVAQDYGSGIKALQDVAMRELAGIKPTVVKFGPGTKPQAWHVQGGS